MPSHAPPSPSHSPSQPTRLLHLPPYPSVAPQGLTPSHPGVAAIFAAAGLDPHNPLGGWIRPGMSVLIKPNWVRHAAEGWAGLESLVTHPSIIRPVVEAAAVALKDAGGKYHGRIILADAPLQSARFDLLLAQSGMASLLSHWQEIGIPIQLVDLRRVIADSDDATAVVSDSYAAPGDPLGDTVVDLGHHSRLEALLQGGGRVGVSNYDCRTTTAHHQPGRHCYRIANSLLEADVVLNLPKWKTHVKTGITGALKNFIGINCDKAYLPHFRVGSPRQGGDEYPDSWKGRLLAQLRPRIESLLPAPLIEAGRHLLIGLSRQTQSPLIFGGAWPGNDTLWRTVHDMVFIARWLGPEGAIRSHARPILSLLDGIVAGQGDGPLRPEPFPLGLLLFGEDPGSIDVHAAAISGFDWRALPLLAHLADPEARSISSFDPAAPLPAGEHALKAPVAWQQRLPRPALPARPALSDIPSKQREESALQAESKKESIVEAA